MTSKREQIALQFDASGKMRNWRAAGEGQWGRSGNFNKTEWRTERSRFGQPRIACSTRTTPGSITGSKSIDGRKLHHGNLFSARYAGTWYLSSLPPYWPGRLRPAEGGGLHRLSCLSSLALMPGDPIGQLGSQGRWEYGSRTSGGKLMEYMFHGQRVRSVV
ncbi:hypothetical protein IF1G_02201 [Cordyceps javanica]|uniref:Uncharacterized protein n=1 Tax=Cordyceps javanica TaxID=43265 RepID=A0A545VE28_9HYPO|nr:hypothetical protein IF1G_02201 [Cordyceps javanica]